MKIQASPSTYNMDYPAEENRLARQAIAALADICAKRCAVVAAANYPAVQCRIYLLAALLLAACGGPRETWTKPGVSDIDLQRDLQQCDAQANAAAPVYYDPRSMSAVSDPQSIERSQFSCMTGRGWQMTPRQ
jgi:hypothetical protein